MHRFLTACFCDSHGEIIWARRIKNIYLWSVLKAKVCIQLHPAHAVLQTPPAFLGIPAWLRVLSTGAEPSWDSEMHRETLVWGRKPEGFPEDN